MARLANNRAGRVLLHLLAVCGDHALRHHWSGVMREIKGE